MTAASFPAGVELIRHRETSQSCPRIVESRPCPSAQVRVHHSEELPGRNRPRELHVITKVKGASPCPRNTKCGTWRSTWETTGGVRNPGPALHPRTLRVGLIGGELSPPAYRPSFWAQGGSVFSIITRTRVTPLPDPRNMRRGEAASSRAGMGGPAWSAAPVGS